MVHRAVAIWQPCDHAIVVPVSSLVAVIALITVFCPVMMIPIVVIATASRRIHDHVSSLALAIVVGTVVVIISSASDDLGTVARWQSRCPVAGAVGGHSRGTVGIVRSDAGTQCERDGGTSGEK